jgi:hypothetical protein
VVGKAAMKSMDRTRTSGHFQSLARGSFLATHFAGPCAGG